jgi:hypothetical protein
MKTRTLEAKREAGRAKWKRHAAGMRDLARSVADEDVAMDGDGLPVVANPARKARCRESLEAFAREYLPHVFTLPISPGQSADMATMQTVATDGGCYAFAAPRGDGKTSRCEAAILWAGLYGLRRCIVIVGADMTSAQEILDSLKTELRSNERLREDFPIPCWAACLSDDTALKARGWTWQGDRLDMVWERARLTLPVHDGADGSGCVFVPRGLTGRLRGMRIKVGMRAVRPDLYAIDDPQTDESARSPAQCDVRETLILGAIMGSAGPGQTISAMMPCTVIEKGDLADRFLDTKRHPDWHGRKRALVSAWPEAQDAEWKRYAEIRRESGPEAANEHYAANREAMDAGAIVEWAERFDPGEVSALQHAENLLCDRGKEVFFAEYQNDPIDPLAEAPYTLTPDAVIATTDRERKPFDLPDWARLVVASTDLNPTYALTTVLVAYGLDHSAAVLWYGLYTEPPLPIRSDASGAEKDRALYDALTGLGRRLAALPVRPSVWAIDAGGEPFDAVLRFSAASGQTCGLRAVGATGRGAKNYRQNAKNIRRRGQECHLAIDDKARPPREWLAWHSDFWREQAQRAFLGHRGAPGSCSLCAGSHREFAAQICAETLTHKGADLDGSVRWLWKTDFTRRHDYLDALSQAYAVAAIEGIGTSGLVPVVRKPQVRRVARVPLEL